MLQEAARPYSVDTFAAGLELSLVVPTRDEAENVGELVRRLDLALAGHVWEVVFVDDDSSDGTAALVRDMATHDRRVRLIHRLNRRGLSSACIEGMLASAAPCIAILDADLQHDERALPRMLAMLRAEGADLVVGSRYAAGGGTGDWHQRRVLLSHAATRAQRLVIGSTVTDPMSGFFVIRRDVVDEVVRDLSGLGFKILLDILATSRRPLRVREVAYEFRARQAGASKFDEAALVDFGMLLLDKSIGRWVPVRFILFAAIGTVGLGVHMVVLFASHAVAGLSFAVAQASATLVAMTANFLLNNLITYRDRRLRGWGLVRGWASFVLACSIGAAANVGVAVYAYDHLVADRSLGWVWSGLAGVAVGAVWNYAVTAVYTWGRR